MHKRLSALIIIFTSLFVLGCGDGISGQAVGESFDEPECQELLVMLAEMELAAEEGTDDKKAYEIMYDAVVHNCRPEQLATDDGVNN